MRFPYFFLGPFIYGGLYPLVNVYTKLWKITMLLMGQFTIMVIFHSFFAGLPEGNPINRPLKNQ